MKNWKVISKKGKLILKSGTEEICRNLYSKLVRNLDNSKGISLIYCSDDSRLLKKYKETKSV